MGEMKDVTLKSLLAGMKNGEGLAFVANDNLGVVDVYAGQVQGCSYHFLDVDQSKNKTFSLNLAAVNCALTISQKSLKDEFSAQAIAKVSKTVDHFNTKSLLEIAKKAIEAQKKMADQTPEEMQAWAKKLCSELAAAGESTLFPVPTLGMDVVSSSVIEPGDIFVVSSSMTKPGKFEIVKLADMPVSNNPKVSGFYEFIYKKDLEFKAMIQGAYDGIGAFDPSMWLSDVTSTTEATLTKELLEEGIMQLLEVDKPKPTHPGAYAAKAQEKLYGEPLIKPNVNPLPIPPPPFGQWDSIKVFAETPGGVNESDAYVAGQDPSTAVKVWHQDGKVYVAVKQGAKVVADELAKEALEKEFGPEVADQVADEKAFYAESNQKEIAKLKKKVDSGVVEELDAVANIAFKVDAMAQQDALIKIVAIEQKLQKINQNHPMAKKIKAELLALKMKYQEMKAKPLQIIEKGITVKALAPDQPLPTIKDIDAADHIKDAFEQAAIGVVKVKAAGHSAVATIVIEKEHITPVEMLDAKLHAVGWRREGEAITIELNTNGSRVLQVDLVRVTQAKKISQDEFAKGIGAEPLGPIGSALTTPIKMAGPALYASASTATTGPIYVDNASPGGDYSVLSFQAQGGKAIILKPDGQVIIPEGMTLDEATQKFWDAIATSNPMRAEVQVLTQKYMELATVYQDTLRRLRRYEGVPSGPTAEDSLKARFGNIANSL